MFQWASLKVFQAEDGHPLSCWPSVSIQPRPLCHHIQCTCNFSSTAPVNRATLLSPKPRDFPRNEVPTVEFRSLIHKFLKKWSACWTLHHSSALNTPQDGGLRRTMKIFDERPLCQSFKWLPPPPPIQTGSDSRIQFGVWPQMVRSLGVTSLG